jgi:hypothetical protein
LFTARSLYYRKLCITLPDIFNNYNITRSPRKLIHIFIYEQTSHLLNSILRLCIITPISVLPLCIQRQKTYVFGSIFPTETLLPGSSIALILKFLLQTDCLCFRLVCKYFNVKFEYRFLLEKVLWFFHFGLGPTPRYHFRLMPTCSTDVRNRVFNTLAQRHPGDTCVCYNDLADNHQFNKQWFIDFIGTCYNLILLKWVAEYPFFFPEFPSTLVQLEIEWHAWFNWESGRTLRSHFNTQALFKCNLLTHLSLTGCTLSPHTLFDALEARRLPHVPLVALVLSDIVMAHVPTSSIPEYLWLSLKRAELIAPTLLWLCWDIGGYYPSGLNGGKHFTHVRPSFTDFSFLPSLHQLTLSCKYKKTLIHTVQTIMIACQHRPFQLILPHFPQWQYSQLLMACSQYSYMNQDFHQDCHLRYWRNCSEVKLRTRCF